MNSTPRVFNFVDVFLRRGMLPHFSIHGRRDQNRRARGERDRGERMTGETVREFGDHVRGRGRDQQKIRAIGELDVTRPPVFFFVVETGRDRILRERLQRQRRDELRRVLRHDDENFVPLFHEQAGELRRFVGGDRTGHAEHDDTFSLSIVHARIIRLLR